MNRFKTTLLIAGLLVAGMLSLAEEDRPYLTIEDSSQKKSLILLPGSQKKHPIRLKNRTDSTIQVLRIQTECGCVDYPDKIFPLSISPHQEKIIDIYLNANKWNKKENTRIVFECGNSNKIMHEINAKLMEVFSQPILKFDFQKSKIIKKSTFITLTLPSDVHFNELGEPNFDERLIQCKIVNKSIVKENIQYRYNVTADGDNFTTLGITRTNIVFPVRNTSDERIILPVIIHVAGNFTYEPKILSFGVVKKGDEKNIFLKATISNDPFITYPFREIRPEGVGLDAVPAQGGTFVIFRSKNCKPGKYEAIVRPILQNGETFTIPVEAFVIE